MSLWTRGYCSLERPEDDRHFQSLGVAVKVVGDCRSPSGVVKVVDEGYMHEAPRVCESSHSFLVRFEQLIHLVLQGSHFGLDSMRLGSVVLVDLVLGIRPYERGGPSLFGYHRLQSARYVMR